MNWFDWSLIALFAIGALANVLLVGQVRGAITPGAAALQVILAAGIIAGVVVYRG